MFSGLGLAAAPREGFLRPSPSDSCLTTARLRSWSLNSGVSAATTRVNSSESLSDLASDRDAASDADDWDKDSFFERSFESLVKPKEPIVTPRVAVMSRVSWWNSVLGTGALLGLLVRAFSAKRRRRWADASIFVMALALLFNSRLLRRVSSCIHHAPGSPASSPCRNALQQDPALAGFLTNGMRLRFATAGASCSCIPNNLAGKLLSQYNDVLRVGRMVVNGEELTWSTQGSSAVQMQSFALVLSSFLRALPEMQRFSDDYVGRAIYWYCKAVSVNYILVDVLALLKKEFGGMCSIQSNTAEAPGVMLDYCLTVQLGKRGSVVFAPRLIWHNRGNVVSMPDPACDSDASFGDCGVRGTLSRVETCFRLPPKRGFTPVYNVRVSSKGSEARGFRARIATIRGTRGRRLAVTEPLSP